MRYSNDEALKDVDTVESGAPEQGDEVVDADLEIDNLEDEPDIAEGATPTEEPEEEGTTDNGNINNDKLGDSKMPFDFKKFNKRSLADTILTIVTVLMVIAVGLKIWDDTRFLEIERTAEYVEYSEFLSAIDKGRVFAVYLVDDEGYKMRYQLRQDVPTEFLNEDPSRVAVWRLDKSKWYYTNFITYDAFVEDTQENNVPILQNKFVKALDIYIQLLIKLGTMGFGIGMLVLCFAYLGKAAGGTTEQRFEVATKSDVKFSDVIGHDEILTDIKNYIALLKNSKKIRDANLKPPKGILFTGPPGTGKTLIAKAMAGEAGIPFIYLNASNVIEMFVGVGAKTIRSCFKQARKLAPCVVFIDEIDAIGNKRGKQQGTSEDTQTLLALLQELDGFKDSTDILVIAATNSPKTLDSALVRAGRFDREIVINPPRTANARYAMLKHYADKINFKDDEVLRTFSQQLGQGTTGADIAGIVNEAGLLAVLNKTDITLELLNEALDKTLLKGNRVKKKASSIDEDQKLVIYHEAGHAVMSYLEGEPISRVTVTGTTSGVGGFVMNGDNKSQFMTQEYLNKRLRILYAGECSERIKFGAAKVTNGASSDIEQATNVVTSMGLQYGMIPALGKMNYGVLCEMGFKLTEEMLTELSKYAAQREEESEYLLREAYALVEKLVTRLEVKDTLTGDEVEALFAEPDIQDIVKGLADKLDRDASKGISLGRLTLITTPAADNM